MRERSVEQTVIRHALARGWLRRKCHWIGRRGAPDQVFSRRGNGPMWVEFKQPGKEPSEQQRREIGRMREAGMTVHVIDNIEDGCALFD